MTRSAATADLILLGMVYEQPHSAYELQKLVEYRNLSRWLPVSAPTVYKNALRLCERGFLAAEPVREGKMPEKTIYSITPAGKAHFSLLMKRNAAARVDVIFPFNAVVANLNKLPPNESAALLSDIRRGMRETLALFEQTLPARRDVTRAGTAILEQQRGVLLYLLEWMDTAQGLIGEGSAEGTKDPGAPPPDPR